MDIASNVHSIDTYNTALLQPFEVSCAGSPEGEPALDRKIKSKGAPSAAYKFDSKKHQDQSTNAV